MDQNEETFEYRYSAKQQEEIEAIRRKYLPKEEDKMEQLRQMHRQPHEEHAAWAWSSSLPLLQQ